MLLTFPFSTEKRIYDVLRCVYDFCKRMSDLIDVLLTVDRVKNFLIRGRFILGSPIAAKVHEQELPPWRKSAAVLFDLPFSSRRRSRLKSSSLNRQISVTSTVYELDQITAAA